MWSGRIDQIPAGWALCNGSNGTPNLTDRFIVGAGYNYWVGATGGANSVALNVNQIPAHRHWYTGDDWLSYANDNGYDSTSESVWVGGYDAGSTQYGDARVWKTSATGGNEAHENRPPYYALAFIMRVK